MELARKLALPALPKRSRGRNSISDEHMRAFLSFFEAWIRRHCTDADGRTWSHRRIARSLGITNYEVSAWRTDAARPGLARLIHLRERTGVPLDRMLGLDV